VIDDFEGKPIAETQYWVTYWDESVPTTINCSVDNNQAYIGSHSLQLDFNVMANSWATCELSYWHPQNWSVGEGLSFFMHASKSAMVFDVLIFGGTPDSRESYTFTLETVQESVDGWTYIEIPWSQIQRVDWEANAGATFNTPDQVVGMAFGIGTNQETDNIGTIWIDDLVLMSAYAPPTPETLPAEEEQSSPSVCPGSASLILMIVFGTVCIRKREMLTQR
jgi:hypothetical protein